MPRPSRAVLLTRPRIVCSRCMRCWNIPEGYGVQGWQGSEGPIYSLCNGCIREKRLKNQRKWDRMRAAGEMLSPGGIR